MEYEFLSKIQTNALTIPFQKADLGICDLTITSERSNAVDFTTPFMNVGIGILYSKAENQSSPFFIFISSLKFNVWLYMSLGYIAVSILVFVISKTPPHPQSEYPAP